MNTNGETKCCGTGLKEVVMPRGSVHYAKMVCTSCGKWKKWAPQPITPETIRKVKLVIGMIPHMSARSTEEKAFLCQLKARLSKNLQPTDTQIYKIMSLLPRGINDEFLTEYKG